MYLMWITELETIFNYFITLKFFLIVTKEVGQQPPQRSYNLGSDVSLPTCITLGWKRRGCHIPLVFVSFIVFLRLHSRIPLVLS